MKKSIFSKIFFINIIVIVVTMLILSVTQYTMISQYIYRERISTLKNNALTIAGYIQNGTLKERLESFLYGFSRSTDTNILIVDSDGQILLSSTHDTVYNENTLRIDKKYTADVFSNREHIVRGTMGGVYKTDMFTLQIPITDSSHSVVLGAILISSTAPEMTRMQSHLARLIGISFLVVIAISFLLSLAISKTLSRPIKKIGSAAKSFAKGDFSSRVQINAADAKIVEIDELARSFNDMASSLERSDEIKNSFISDVSHELRTPMTTIGGFVDGILDDTIPPERQRDYLLIVKDEITRLSSLVNSFLDIARLQNDKGALEMTVFDVNELIRRALVSFESKIEEKSIFVDISTESDVCTVKADKNRIRQVLNNLIENAVKFTNPNGLLKITTSVGQNEAEIVIYNTGCGIADEDIRLIFERFYKSDKSRSLNKSGTGIGLYIVKDILGRHGKDIYVRSKYGEFAEFKFSLDKANG